MNYVKHLAEAANARGEVPDVPQRAEIGYRAQNALIAHDEDVVIPAIATEKIHYEGELAVVIGKKAKHLSEADALSCVFGYTIGNDVSERDMQKADGQWTRAKGFDSFCPLGPWIETDPVALGLDPTDLEISCTVDGEPRQQGRTSQLIFGLPTLISYISQVMTLLPGDVVLTGTPSGVGPIRPGQRVECTIEGLGTLANTVTAAEPVSTAGGAR
jgi:2-keto-4-pentenoate hydratase/2-oxohepta-3-ene-1,7-dioic acid hydratase in catechol pathway